MTDVNPLSLLSRWVDKSNLLVCRSPVGAEVPGDSLALHQHHISQMVFHKIRKEDLTIVRRSVTSPRSM